jgi:RNA polymerase sigma-70 factor, ECF subfamily
MLPPIEAGLEAVDSYTCKIRARRHTPGWMVEQREDVLGALARLVLQQRAELIGLARREGLGAEDALDCVHDAFCRLLDRAQKEVRSEQPGGELIAGMVVNLARNKRRRHHLAVRHEPIDSVDTSPEEPPIDLLLGHVEDCVRLKGCLSKLCQSQRVVVMMRLLEERPGEDVAAALGLTRGYVDVLLHRARASRRVCMLEG